MVDPSAACASGEMPLNAASAGVYRLLAAAIDHSVSPGCTVCGTAAPAELAAMAGTATAAIVSFRKRRAFTSDPPEIVSGRSALPGGFRHLLPQTAVMDRRNRCFTEW